MDLKAYVYRFVICSIAYIHFNPWGGGNNEEDRQVDY